MAVVEAIVLLVAVGKVAVLEVVVAKVASTSLAVVIVATPEVVNVEVKVFLAALVERFLVGHVGSIISKPLLGLLPWQLQML